MKPKQQQFNKGFLNNGDWENEAEKEKQFMEERSKKWEEEQEMMKKMKEEQEEEDDDVEYYGEQG